MALGIAKTFAACDHVCIQLHVPCIYNNIAMYYIKIILCSYKNIVIVIVAINNVLCEVCELAQPMHVYKI